MVEWKLTTQSDSMVIYEQRASQESYQTAYFDLRSKTLHVTYTEFERNGVQRLVPQGDATYYSAKYGCWRTHPAYLGIEDIRKLSKLAEELIN